jgi:hypothetical protein
LMSSFLGGIRICTNYWFLWNNLGISNNLSLFTFLLLLKIGFSLFLFFL